MQIFCKLLRRFLNDPSKINKYDKSLENHQLAVTIAKSIDDTFTYALCLQNIGKLYSKKNESNKAIEYYLKSFEMRKNNSTIKRLSLCPV
ncbi:tetratricopeptide repeat protein [Oceanobacillus neutriphilus]|uniref:Tetratricopeptide repeat protein n=1 Tax=Oceanobacillus neutriphilus TaxID=531815 RepID=A0ABQ2P1T8_9BACI|nr:hypothetical protein GCM10011346_46980 [Oceanobacillus neutriphilus]